MTALALLVVVGIPMLMVGTVLLWAMWDGWRGNRQPWVTHYPDPDAVYDQHADLVQRVYDESFAEYVEAAKARGEL